MTKNFDIFKKRLHSYGLSPIEIEILLCFAQNNLIQASKISSFLPPSHRLKGPRIYDHLKQLSQKGWLHPAGTKPLMYRFADPTEIRIILESLISKAQLNLEKQKNNYYEVISSFDELHENILGNRKKTSEALMLPSQVNSSFKSIIISTHENTPISFFNGEYNAIIVLNNDDVQFRLNAAEFHWINGSSLYAGIIICEIDPASKRADILEFIHDYNVNGLKFKYKLESKGYVENKARKITKYDFSDAYPNEKPLTINTAFTFHIDQTKKTGLLQTRQLSAANGNNGLKIITFWTEDPQMNPWIELFWRN
ncbi:MAG: hypothetical protein ACTSRK_18005 [Promethearchaeota archaeon]